MNLEDNRFSSWDEGCGLRYSLPSVQSTQPDILSPPCAAAFATSSPRPNCGIRGPSWPDWRAALKDPKACRANTDLSMNTNYQTALGLPIYFLGKTINFSISFTLLKPFFRQLPKYYLHGAHAQNHKHLKPILKIKL